MNIIAQITIGPSDHERHAVDYGVQTRRREAGSCYLASDDGGGYPLAWSRHPSDPDRWLRAARRHVGLPRAVRAAGQRWVDAKVEPLGWSEGAGHAPGGVKITWREA